MHSLQIMKGGRRSVLFALIFADQKAAGMVFHMAQLKIDRSSILALADAIEGYCTEQKQLMKDADASVKDMLSNNGWTGADANAFYIKWEGIDDDDSATVQFRKLLESYAEGLRAAEAAYKTAQENIYNCAWRLKW